MKINHEPNSYIKNSIFNAISGIVNRVVILLVPFLLRTILIYTLGEQYLGLSGLFSSLLQVLNLADLGFSSAITYDMYKPIAENDIDRICALLALYKKVYRIVGLIILVMGLGLLPFLENFIEGDYPSDINLNIVYLIYLSNTVISYVFFAHKRSLLTAYQKSYIDRTINSILHILFDILRGISLFVIPNYYLYIVFYPISTFLENFMLELISRKMYPQCICKGKLDKVAILAMKKRVLGICFQKFGSTLSLSMDSVIISTFLGLTSLAIFSNYFYIVSSIMSFGWVIISSVIASVGSSIANEGTGNAYIHFKRVSLINKWMITVCISSLLCLYQHFMYIWVGESLMASGELVFCLVLYFFIAQSRKVVLIFKEAAGLWWEDKWKSIIAGVINLVLSLILVQAIGMSGVIIATVLSYLFVELPWETKILFKLCFQKKVKYFYFDLVKDLCVNLMLVIICLKVCSVIPNLTITSFFLKGVTCVIITNVIFITIYRKTEEFNYFIGKICKKNNN